MNNKIAFHCRNFTRNCEIDQTYSSEGVIYIARSNIEYGKVIKILFKSILLDILILVQMSEKKSKTIKAKITVIKPLNLSI